VVEAEYSSSEFEESESSNLKKIWQAKKNASKVAEHTSKAGN